MRLEPTALTFDDRWHGGEMEAAVDVLDRAPHCNRIGDVGLDEFDATRQILASAARQIVEHAHGVAARRQCLDEMGPDETAAAGNEVQPPRMRSGFGTKKIRRGITVEHRREPRAIAA